MTKTQEAREKSVPAIADELRLAADAAFSKKATNVVVLDLRKVPSFTDYFLLCSTQHQRQAQAVAEAIEEVIRKTGVKPAHVEGYGRSDWILLDYFTFVIHVFTREAREFYGLERLWGSAERIELADCPA
ncbi:MAG: ribosome silencing factor [Acidobacteriota bacterium]